MSPLLELQHIHKSFGGVVAAHDVSLRLDAGARHAVIGPNGAGKTTLVNLITGMLRPSGGRIHLEGRDITPLPLHERVRCGLVRSFQLTSLFPTFSAFENIALAVAQRAGVGRSVSTAQGFPPAIADEAESIAGQLRLRDVGARRVGELSYGQQRLLELALALALRPRVLLLDEPAAGLAADDQEAVLDAIAGLPADTAVLLIEHDMRLVFRFARQITVLAGGSVLASGSPEAIRNNAEVRAVYLGVRHG